MTSTILTIVLIPGLIGVCIILASGIGFMNKAQAKMEVDKNLKRRAIRWLAVGSVCVGVSFGLVTLLIATVTAEVELPILGKVLTALLFGAGWTAFLFGCVLISFAWFENVTLPARRKMRERSQAKKEE